MDLRNVRITEDQPTLEEEYELQRIEGLSEEEQRLVYLHHLDQFEAVPSYLEQQMRRFAGEDL